MPVLQFIAATTSCSPLHSWPSFSNIYPALFHANCSMQEIVSISSTTLPNYEAKIKSFYEEHIHADDEIRYILDGQGLHAGIPMHGSGH